MTTLIARLKDVLDAANYQSELLYVLRTRDTVIKIVAALEAAQQVDDEMGPNLEAPPSTGSAMILRAALAALEGE